MIDAVGMFTMVNRTTKEQRMRITNSLYSLNVFRIAIRPATSLEFLGGAKNQYLQVKNQQQQQQQRQQHQF